LFELYNLRQDISISAILNSNEEKEGVEAGNMEEKEGVETGNMEEKEGVETGNMDK